jgi:hypothetical protein
MNEPWEVYDYEEDMFQRTLSLLRKKGDYPFPIPNALVESMLLHLRILIEILLSSGWHDDIKLEKDLLPGFNSPLIAELDKIYGDGSEHTHRWTLNKRLAHASNVRSDQFDWTPMLKELLPPIVALLVEIQAERAKAQT